MATNNIKDNSSKVEFKDSGKRLIKTQKSILVISKMDCMMVSGNSNISKARMLAAFISDSFRRANAKGMEFSFMEKIQAKERSIKGSGKTVNNMDMEN